MKILKAEPADKSGEAGVIFSADGDVYVGCGSGSLRLLQVQPEGGKRMEMKAFALGHKTEGVKLGR